MNYCEDRNNVSEKKWVDQNSRFHKKLLPEHFRIDEKTLADFSLFAADYGKMISFFNAGDRPDGDWSSFFRDDPTMCLLFLQSLNTEEWSNQSTDTITKFEKTKSEHTKLTALKELVILATAMFVEIEHAVAHIHVYKDFHSQLVKYIANRLSPYLLIVIEVNKLLREQYEWRNPAVLNYDIAFGRYWYSHKPFVFEETDDAVHTAALVLGQHMPKIIHDIEILKRETHTFLNEEVLTKGNIKPHIALFIAFCDLYKHAQKKLNNISERHLAHYYHNILNLNPLPGNSDSVYLNFNATKGAGTIELDKHTQFNYSVDADNTPIYFTLDSPVAVHEGSIKKLTAVNVSSKPWQNLFMNRTDKDVSVFDIFNPDNENVQLGFEIASQYLILEEGDRRITFDFALSKIETIKLKEKINSRFSFDLPKLNELIAHAWSAYYSNPLGMQPVEEKGLNVFFLTGKDEEQLILRFDVLLKRYEPAFLSPDPENAEADAVLQFILNAKGLTLYSLFRDISFTDPQMDIAVIGIKNLILQNDLGILEAGHPFEPFGPLPVIGSGFIIGHKNLFLKPLQELIINFEWNNLPLDANGFKSYYKDYAGIQDNSSFKIKIAGLKDKNWLPVENKQVLDLFIGIPTDDTLTNNALSTVRRMNEIDVQSLGLNKESRILGPLKEYDITSTAGFIKMELCYPEEAFGHRQYPELVQKTAFRSVKEKNEPEPINAPYTPSLKSVSVEYKSSIAIKHWSEKITLRKLHPFGSELAGGSKTWSILPYFPDGGSFFIALDPLLSNKEISFLFKISTKHNSSNNEGTESFKISVLEKSDWISVASEKITYDGTKQLQRTGIFKIKLPEVNAVDNLIDGKSLWLRFDLTDPDTGKYIENIHLNAGTATRDHLLDLDSTPVPEYTLDQLKNPIVQIDTIEQPYRSFGGRNPESEDTFRMKISERIRHKARAVSNKDIETLLLAAFPEIQSLKCLNHINAELKFQPGSTIVVVIPVEDEESDVLERYFPKEQLTAMEDYLNTRALSGMKIQVVNPVYEKIRLKFNVKFRQGYDEKSSFKKLYAKIMTFLDPWKSYKIINQGGVIPVTTVLNEIELEDYVDFITNFSVFHIVNGQIINLNVTQRNNLIIKAKSPISVLIPDINHKLLSFNDQIATDKPGINDMMIGNDFLVHTTVDTAESGLGFDVLGKTFRLSSGDEKLLPEKHTFTMYLKD